MAKKPLKKAIKKPTPKTLGSGYASKAASAAVKRNQKMKAEIDKMFPKKKKK